METKQIVDSILEAVRQEVIDFVEDEPNFTCPIKYEKRVGEIARKFAIQLIEGDQRDVPKSRNAKKKYLRRLGK